MANEAFFIASNKVRLWLWLSLYGSFVTVPINIYLILTIPVWGTAWGIAVYQNWVLVHFACIGWYLYRHRHHDTFGDGGDKTAAPAAAAPAMGDSGTS